MDFLSDILQLLLQLLLLVLVDFAAGSRRQLPQALLQFIFLFLEKDQKLLHFIDSHFLVFGLVLQRLFLSSLKGTVITGLELVLPSRLLALLHHFLASFERAVPLGIPADSLFLHPRSLMLDSRDGRLSLFVVVLARGEILVLLGLVELTLRFELDFQFFDFLDETELIDIGLLILLVDLGLQPQVFLQKHIVLPPHQLLLILLVLEVVVFDSGLENQVLQVPIQILDDVEQVVLFFGELDLGLEEFSVLAGELVDLVLVDLVRFQIRLFELQNLVYLLLLLHDDLLQLRDVFFVEPHYVCDEILHLVGHIQGLESL